MSVDVAIALGYAAACVNGSEGFSATAFLDRIANPWVWTIGHGTTRVNGVPVRQGMTCSKAQADAWSAADMQGAMTYVLMYVDVPLDNWQAAALCSLTYNCGMGAFRRSSVLAALNEGYYRTAADCFLEYDHAGGKQIPGLTARRKRERAMFLCMMPVLPVLSEADELSIGVPTPPIAIPAVTKPQPAAEVLSEADILNEQELRRLKENDV